MAAMRELPGHCLLWIRDPSYGLASILHTRAIDSLKLTDECVEDLIESTLVKIGMALGLKPNPDAS